MATCYRHPNVETFRTCGRCDRPTCSDCLRDAPVGFQCVECIRKVAPTAAAQVKRTVRVNKNLALSDLPVTKLLIAANLVVFVLGQAGAKWAQPGRLALASSLISPLGEYYRLVSAGFLHYGFLHIAFNMYALWGLGNALEGRLGPKRYFLLYFVALLGGSAGALALEPRALVGGASGAVFGLFGALAVALRSRGVSVMKSPLGPTLLINFFLTFAVPGISKGGHVGGFIFGAVAGYITLRPNKRGDTEWQDVGALLALGLVAVGLALFLAQRTSL
jgi:membrane associated rhomboid family serine protease